MNVANAWSKHQSIPPKNFHTTNERHLSIRQHGDVVPVQGALTQGTDRREHLLLAGAGVVDRIELKAHCTTHRASETVVKHKQSSGSAAAIRQAKL